MEQKETHMEKKEAHMEKKETHTWSCSAWQAGTVACQHQRHCHSPSVVLSAEEFKKKRD